MFKKKWINNYYALLLKKKWIKYEKKKNLLRSIIQNQKIKPVVRSYAFYKLIQIKKNAVISRQLAVCFETGKLKSKINQFNRSRHITKKFGLVNKLPSINVKSW